MVDESGFENRRKLYMLLAKALSYPEDLEDYTESIKKLLGEVEFAIPEKLAISLKEALKELKELGEEKVQAEFTRLFINAYPTVPCPPYESAYREGTLMGKSAEKMESILSKWGLETDEMPDHAGPELELMAFLLGIPQTDEAKADQVMLFKDHISKWFPKFSRDIFKNTSLNFFKSVALLIDETLKMESKFLERE